MYAKIGRSALNRFIIGKYRPETGRNNNSRVRYESVHRFRVVAGVVLRRKWPNLRSKALPLRVWNGNGMSRCCCCCWVVCMRVNSRWRNFVAFPKEFGLWWWNGFKGTWCLRVKCSGSDWFGENLWRNLQITPEVEHPWSERTVQSRLEIGGVWGACRELWVSE